MLRRPLRIKPFSHETIDEALKLESALEKLQTAQRVALLPHGQAKPHPTSAVGWGCKLTGVSDSWGAAGALGVVPNRQSGTGEAD